MPKAIPIEVREKIVAAYEKGTRTQNEIAEIFDTTQRTVTRFVTKKRMGKGLEIKPRSGRPSPMDSKELVILKDIVLLQPDKTVLEYCHLFQKKTGLKISRSSMSRFLKKLNLRRKKKSLYAQAQDRPDVKKKRRFHGSARK